VFEYVCNNDGPPFDVIFDAVVSVDTFNGCCDRFKLMSGGGNGRELLVVGVCVAVVPTPDDDGTVGIGMCFNI
jgi:hypothetical protein